MELNNNVTPIKVDDSVNTSSPEMPQATPPAATPPATPQKPKSNKLAIWGLVGIIALALLGLSSATAYALAVAYGKIETKNEVFKLKVSKLVLNSPLPKTPQMVLEVANQTEQDAVKSGYLDGSYAIKMDLPKSSPEDELAFQMLGIDPRNFEVGIKGSFVAPTDPKKPEDMGLDFVVQMDKMADLNFICKDKMCYFKLSKLSPLLQTLAATEAGINKELYMDRWVSMDISKLNTEASQNLSKNQLDKNAELEKKFADLMKKIVKDGTLKTFTLKEEKLDGLDTYKVTVVADKEAIKPFIKLYQDEFTKNAGLEGDYLMPSTTYANVEDVITSIEMELWYGKKDLITRKFSFKAEGMVPESSFSGSGGLKKSEPAAFSVAGVFTISKINENIVIEKPAKSTTAEDFMQEIIMASSYSRVGGAGGAANDSQISSYHQMGIALINEFVQTNKRAPKSLAELGDNKDLLPSTVVYRVSKNGNYLLISTSPLTATGKDQYLMTEFNYRTGAMVGVANKLTADQIKDRVSGSIELGESKSADDDLLLDDPYPDLDDEEDSAFRDLL